MNDGFWINYKNPEVIYEIHEHERWIRTPGNAKKLGVPKAVIAMFNKFQPEKDRDKFLTFVMLNAPVMRARAHGIYVTFEYVNNTDALPLKAVKKWCNKFAGPVLFLRIVNLKTGMIRTGFPGLKLKKERLSGCGIKG